MAAIVWSTTAHRTLQNSDWHLPNIKGLDSFRGVVAHSANYPDDLDLTNKSIAVVGNGSSGIQLVSHVQPDVKQLFTWVRSPTWMTAGFSQKWAGENGANFECELQNSSS